MFDFRLKVFRTVALRLNFTKAAEELFITQPAVSKHIHEIEQHYQVKLFDRNGSKIKLTVAGELLLQYSSQIFSTYDKLEYELNNLNHSHKGALRIGASTTIAQYVLPPILAAFHLKNPNVRVLMSINNTEQIESALQKNEIDFGIIEGQTKNVSFKYTDFVKDEIVLVSKIDHPLAPKESVRLNELLMIPLLLREPGSGTLEVIAHALKYFNIKITDLKTEMQLGSTESIKSYLLNSNCMAFLSVYSILKELRNNEFCIIDVDDLTIERNFRFIQQLGDVDPLSELFINFSMKYNFR